MHRLLLAIALPAAALFAPMIATAPAASAAPVITSVQAPVADGAVKDVYWVRRGHRRVWVPDHHHYRR